MRLNFFFFCVLFHFIHVFIYFSMRLNLFIYLFVFYFIHVFIYFMLFIYFI